MALTTSNAFIGKNRSQILTSLVLGAETIDKGMIQVIENVFDDTFIQRMTMADDPLTAPVDTPSSSKTVAKTERQMVPGSAEVYVEFNPNTFQNDWEDYWPTGPRVDNEIPQALMAPLLEVIGKKVNKQVEKMIWQGNTAGAAGVNRWDGYLKLIDADGDVVDVGTPLVLTAANILGELERAVAAVSNDVYADPGVRIACSHTDFRLFTKADRAQTTKGEEQGGRAAPKFDTIPLVPLNGIPKDRLVIGKFGADINSNFYAQTWMSADKENFKVERLQANSALFFVKATFQYGVQYGFGDEIVNYKGS